MIEADVTISQLVAAKTLLKPDEYVHSVLLNCWEQFRVKKWPRDRITVRIGRIGDGKAPNYMIEVQSDVKPTPEQAEQHWNGVQMHEGVDTAIEFNGLGHKVRAYGFDRETWSTATQTLVELEELEKNMKK